MGGPRPEMGVSARTLCTGAAWLSSARVVRCWVKSRNERNPRLQLPSGRAGHSEGTAGDKPEEGGDDVKSSWPLCPGLHTCYNGVHKGTQTREREPIPKNTPQFRSKAETRLREAGIASIRGSETPRGRCSWGFYTPPVKPRKGGASEVAAPTARGQAPKTKLLIGT